MTREEALSSYTAWASFFSFHESRKGTLERGKWADFVVLSDDIMNVEDRKIPLVRVEMTGVGGRIVFDRSRVAAGATE
jgi:predicted amidohydrolase YtcJ